MTTSCVKHSADRESHLWACGSLTLPLESVEDSTDATDEKIFNDLKEG